MVVEREVLVVVAGAEVNDEFGVTVTLFDAQGDLSVSEARDLAAELVAAADEAATATLDAVVPDVEPLEVDRAPVGSVFQGGAS